MRSLIHRSTALLAGLLMPALLAAQTAVAPAAPVGPKVGDMAPDFTLSAATMQGVAAAPVKLSSLRGKTVVLAFFPRARTSGCTIQMKHYRDEYAAIFGGGKAASLYAISSDSSSVTAAWAGEEKFPFTFLADVNLEAGKLYGTAPARGTAEQRVAFVIGPDGRIVSIMRPFREIDATAYTDLTAAIAAAGKGVK